MFKINWKQQYEVFISKKPIFQFCSLKGPRNNEDPVAMRIPGTQILGF